MQYLFVTPAHSRNYFKVTLLPLIDLMHCFRGEFWRQVVCTCVEGLLETDSLFLKPRIYKSKKEGGFFFLLLSKSNKGHFTRKEQKGKK